MKRIFSISMLCIVAALIAVGCCRCRSKSRAAVSLTGHTWQLVKLMGQDIAAEGESFTITFNEDGRLNGVGSCNRLFGDYTATADGKIEVGQLGSTRMMCPDVERENRYFMTIGEATAYEIDGQTLMLIFDGEVRAIFNQVADAE